MSRIDYSKWDHLDVSSSDEEEADGGQGGGQLSAPRVTKLDRPSRITTQSDGSLLIHQQQEQQQQKHGIKTTKVAKETGAASSEKRQNKKTEEATTDDDQYPALVPSQWTEKGGTATITATGNEQVPLYWSQDRYSVTLRILLPSSTSGSTDSPQPGRRRRRRTQWKVQTTGVLQYPDRNCAVPGGAAPHLKVLHSSSPSNDTNENSSSSKDKPFDVWWQDDLPHPIHHAQDYDDDDDDTIDWSIETATTTTTQEEEEELRYLTMTLYKAVPMEGLTLWWNRPVASCPEVELTWRQQADGNSAAKKNDSAESFQKAWKEAHAQFREQMKSKKALDVTPK